MSYSLPGDTTQNQNRQLLQTLLSQTTRQPATNSMMPPPSTGVHGRGGYPVTQPMVYGQPNVQPVQPIYQEQVQYQPYPYPASQIFINVCFKCNQKAMKFQLPQSIIQPAGVPSQRMSAQSKNDLVNQKTLENRRDQARKFFRDLKALPKPQVMHTNLLPSLQDTERILQILTNAQYVESKTHHGGGILHNSWHDQHAPFVSSDEQQALTYQKAMAQKDNSDDEEVDFEQFLDIEDKKILNKRKKRTAKIEECNIDLDQFMNARKRRRLADTLTLKGSPHSEEDTAVDVTTDASIATVVKEQRESIKRKLIEKYFAELQENVYTRQGLINYVKYMIKNIQFSNLTSDKNTLKRITEFQYNIRTYDFLDQCLQSKYLKHCALKNYIYMQNLIRMLKKGSKSNFLWTGFLKMSRKSQLKYQSSGYTMPTHYISPKFNLSNQLFQI